MGWAELGSPEVVEASDMFTLAHSVQKGEAEQRNSGDRIRAHENPTRTGQAPTPRLIERGILTHGTPEHGRHGRNGTRKEESSIRCPLSIGTAASEQGKRPFGTCAKPIAKLRGGQKVR